MQPFVCSFLLLLVVALGTAQFCEQGLARTVDNSAHNVGAYSSLAIGADSFAIISYFDASAGSLKLYHCTSANCSTGAAFEFNATGSVVGEHSSIAIGTNNKPVVSFYDVTLQSLKLYFCVDQQCSSGAAITLDSDGDVGRFSSLAIGDDSYPIVSYYDATLDDLKFYKCAATDCASGSVHRLVSSGDVGQYTSLAVGSNTYPIISYYDVSLGALNLYVCASLSCSSGTSVRVDNVAADVGQYSAVVVGADHFPVMCYFDATNGDLRVYHCASTDCTSGVARTLDTGGVVGKYCAIALGADSFPVISYMDETNNALKGYRCAALDCSSGSFSTLDSDGSVGEYTSLAVGADNAPIVSYYDSTNGNLKVYHCEHGALRELCAESTAASAYVCLCVLML